MRVLTLDLLCSMAMRLRLFHEEAIRRVRPLFAYVCLAIAILANGVSYAQSANPITRDVDHAVVEALPNHHPLWANDANSVGAVPADQPVDSLTVVLSRSPKQELAFEAFLASQQDPTSPDYHHWLTPAEVGKRFGLSDQDIASVSRWLQSQGLHVNWVSPSRLFVGFGGTAADVGRAFHTEMRLYQVNGVERMSVSSDPMIPSALAPAIKSIRGLYFIDDRPLHAANPMHSASPELTAGQGQHFLVPADFATVYDLPSGSTGAGQTIGIVGRSRTNFADFDNFRQKTGSNFADPTEIVPTAFGGVDPGPALTAPPASGVSTGEQLEATLDVTRAGSVATAAQLQLVVATNASGGIEADGQYLVQTTPVPAQVMTISFGACESAGGPSGVKFWDTLFQQAAAEGISVFVSSGDSGASGCDTAFATPPASPQANSPNYICSSSYATCVGGTQFNDTANPSRYWNSSNASNLSSALSYIPEGGWNEPLDSTSKPLVSSSGGGVSSVIATPSWQTGTGVPAARAGRYTPDVAFSSSGHDGYFMCFAAGVGNCVSASNGSFEFEYVFGTSAAAPSMAGIAALLDEKLGPSQGNLNPEIYAMAATSPASFHDVTVASSGVSGCSVNTPSMCNNSIPGPGALSGGQAGYLVTAGYDEVTGLGSLDVSNFLDHYTGVKDTSTVTFDIYPSSVTTAQALSISVTVSAVGAGAPTGSVTLAGGGYTSAAVPITIGAGDAGYGQFNIPANSLAAGNDMLTVTYTPDSGGAAYYNSASGSAPVTVTAVPIITPLVSIVAPSSNTTAQSLTLTVYLNAGIGGGGFPNQNPTGHVQLVSGSYNSGPLAIGAALNAVYITIPAETLPVGTDTLTATYTPDAASAGIYTSASGSSTVIVTTSAQISPGVGLVLNPMPVTTAQILSVTVYVTPGASGYLNPTGSVILTSGSYSSAPAILNNAIASISIPAGTLPIGNDILTATYTPDAAGSLAFIGASGSMTITVVAPPQPAFKVSDASVTLQPGATTGNSATISVSPSGGFTGSVVLTAAITSSPAGAQDLPTLSFGGTTPVNITGTTGGSATLTISTTAATSAALPKPDSRAGPWYTAGGAALACILLYGMPARHRRWRSLLGICVLLAAFVSGMLACGGGGNSSTTPSKPANPGTTAGAYVVTVTGTSGSIVATGTVTLTVQ